MFGTVRAGNARFLPLAGGVAVCCAFAVEGTGKNLDFFLIPSAQNAVDFPQNWSTMNARQDPIGGYRLWRSNPKWQM